MCPEEWLVGTHLVPTDEELWPWVLEEATHVSWKGRKVGKEGEGGLLCRSLRGLVLPLPLSPLLTPRSYALYLARLPPNQGPQFFLLSPPQKDIPTSPKLRHIGIEIFKWSHSAVLSPVHTAPEEDEREGGSLQTATHAASYITDLSDLPHLL